MAHSEARRPRFSFYREPAHVAFLAEPVAAFGERELVLALVDEIHVVARTHADAL